MPTITFSLKDLQNLVGKKLPIEEVQELAHYGKGDFEGYDEVTDEVKIDFGDTNLPYLWSVEGFARLLKGVLGIQKGIPEIKVHKGSYQVIVDKSVIKIRPYIACFIAKACQIDNYLLKQIVQLQEKFCETYGRRRQKVSIGLYSYKRLDFPIHYKAVEPSSLKFAPLEYKSKMNLKEILAEHPKGKEYAWILEGLEQYPVLMDNKSEAMSLVPIINSGFAGKLEIGDDSMLFEATGTDEHAVILAASIFAYALYERGFQLYSAEINYPNKKVATPYLAHESAVIRNEQINRLFGLELKENEVKRLLEKARYGFSSYKVRIPAYRADIMHPYDIIEDIGIMYGFGKIKELPLNTFTRGSSLKISDFIDKVREIIVGIGYQETMRPILTNKDFLYRRMNIEDFGSVELNDYMSETYSVVRSWILPSLMEILSKNRHVSFPQKIFEEGLVNIRKVESVAECNTIALALSHDKADYTEIRQALDCIMKCLGLHYDIKEDEHGSFINGRCARAIIKGKKIAYLGEISPIVLERWGLEMPTSALELNLTELFWAIENLMQASSKKSLKFI